MNLSFSNGDNTVSKEFLDNENTGICVLCGLFTSQHCKRCGDFYCSDKCQSIDWPNHRYICFPIPPLVRTTGATKEDDICLKNMPGYDNETLFKELNDMKVSFMKELHSIQRRLDNAGLENKENINDLNSIQALLLSNSESNTKSDSTKIKNDKINISKDSGNATNNALNSEVGSSDNIRAQSLRSSKSNGSRVSINKSQLNGIAQPALEAHDDRVILSAFRSTNRCFVRSKLPEVENKFRAITEKIDSYGRNAPQMKTLPKVGTYAITLKSNNHYARVKINKCESEDRIRVLFCDYGTGMGRKLSDLRVITPELASLPEFLTTVQLYGVQMVKYSDELTEYLKSFERKEYRMECINENGNNNVKLFDIETGQLLNELITNFCAEIDASSKQQVNISDRFNIKNKNSSYSSSTQSHCVSLHSDSNTEAEEEKSDVPRVAKPPFETHLLTAGARNVKVVIVDTNLIEYGYVACIPKDDFSHLTKIQKFLNTTDLGNKPYEPKLNEYCVAQFEDEWYRGVVVGIVDGGKNYEISYIDFLNEATLTKEFIRPYPKDLKIDCYTTLCRFDGLPKALNEKQREFLASVIAIKDVLPIDRVVQIEAEKCARIECSALINAMQNKNLL